MSLVFWESKYLPSRKSFPTIFFQNLSVSLQSCFSLFMAQFGGLLGFMILVIINAKKIMPYSITAILIFQLKQVNIATDLLICFPIYFQCFIVIHFNLVTAIKSLMLAFDPVKFLTRQPLILHFPKISTFYDPIQSSMEKFNPVLKKKINNLLKMKELRQHYEKDKRMGRVYSIDYASKMREEEEKQMNQSIDYQNMRNIRNKKVFNGSFVKMTEKIRETRYYCSIQK